MQGFINARIPILSLSNIAGRTMGSAVPDNIQQPTDDYDGEEDY